MGLSGRPGILISALNSHLFPNVEQLAHEGNNGNTQGFWGIFTLLFLKLFAGSGWGTQPWVTKAVKNDNNKQELSTGFVESMAMAFHGLCGSFEMSKPSSQPLSCWSSVAPSHLSPCDLEEGWSFCPGPRKGWTKSFEWKIFQKEDLKWQEKKREKHLLNARPVF